MKGGHSWCVLVAPGGGGVVGGERGGGAAGAGGGGAGGEGAPGTRPAPGPPSVPCLAPGGSVGVLRGVCLPLRSYLIIEEVEPLGLGTVNIEPPESSRSLNLHFVFVPFKKTILAHTKI